MNRFFFADSNYVLNKIFNNEQNIDIGKRIIEDFLGIEIQEITLEEQMGEISNFLPKNKHYGIAKYRILTKDNKRLNIGIQIIDGLYIQEKILVYASLMHANQEGYKEKNAFNKTITINIIDTRLIQLEKYHNIITLDEEMIFHLIELPKFKKSNIETNEDAWIVYMKSDREDLVQKAKEKCTEIKKLDELLKKYWKKEKLE